MSARLTEVMAEELSTLSDDQLQHRIAVVRDAMRPVEQELARLRSERDVLLTEQRRRERLTRRQSRADLKAAMGEGRLPTIAELVAGADSGSFDDFTYNLKTGGEVALGFPGSRTPSLAFTDGAQTAQAKDFAEAERLYAKGWELGSPGRPGVRIHFPGTRQEKLVSADEVYVRPK